MTPARARASASSAGAEVEVVGRGSAELGGQQRPTLSRELLDVQLQPIAAIARGRQDPTCFVDRKGLAFYEDVAERGLGGEGRQHLVEDQAHVVLTPFAILGRHRVRAEERGQHAAPDVAAARSH